jgi:hypothetical protein
MHILGSVKSKIFNQVKKFTNELVGNSKKEKIQRVDTGIHRPMQSQTARNFYQPKSQNTSLLPSIMGKNDKPHRIDDTRVHFGMNMNEKLNNDDSYISDTNDRTKENIMNNEDILLYGMQKKDKEMAKLYKRMDDLHNLELKYFKESDNRIVQDQQEFNEIYYNFKKKYMKERRKSTVKNYLKPMNASDLAMEQEKNFLLTKQKEKNERKQRKAGSMLIKEEFVKELFSDPAKIVLPEQEREINTYRSKRENLRSTSTIGLATTRHPSPLHNFNKQNIDHPLFEDEGKVPNNNQIKIFEQKRKQHVRTSIIQQKKGSAPLINLPDQSNKFSK